MPRKSYVTSVPDKTGAFLLASKIIARHNGNIVRVSYNKAVDLHTIFIDVEASEDSLQKITNELGSVGYLNNIASEVRVIIVEIKIPDIPGAVLPVLKILDRYDINISYINSSTNNTNHQYFKMGLLIENPTMIKMLLDDISELYPINIVDYDASEKNLDNTIFYIRLANEMQQLLNLSPEKTMEFISESNRILQILQDRDLNTDKVFDYIRRFAYFISRNRGSSFKADIEKLKLSDDVTLYNIQPPCGSNTYVLASQDEVLLIDTGYAIYAEEMLNVLQGLFTNWKSLHKRVYITHADVDHCGMLSKLEVVEIYMNQKSSQSLRRQQIGAPDFREINDMCFGYNRLSRIISGYVPPNADSLNIIDHNTPEEHENLLEIGKFSFAGLDFTIYEGSGGHLYGEMVFVCREKGIAFTGDLLVNISGFSAERAEFNSLAPYLMTSVNIDSRKATEMRNEIIRLADDIGSKNQKPFIICGGHGPISIIKTGKLVNNPEVEIVD